MLDVVDGVSKEDALEVSLYDTEFSVVTLGVFV